MEHLKGLNDKQKEAVLYQNGPLLILAGAGAGKTKTVTTRITHLIKTGVEPKSILAITFTNKAAKEMRERLMLPQTGERPFVSTFHALGVHILKENVREIGLTRHFSIFDKSDSQKTVRDIIRDLGLDPKQHEPGKYLSIISREKGNLKTVEDFNTTNQNELIGRVWAAYEKKLKEGKALDFDDLLLKTYKLLKNKPEILQRYQQIWTYIHVDEYQDTNQVQYMITKLLAEKNRNICVVGDIDQNIYSWRGADIKNILHFEKDYPEAKIILLEENYRSTQNILAVANAIIKKNVNRVEKNLFTKNAEGEKLTLYTGFNENEESHFIANKSKELIASGVEPRNIAVLYRANFQSRAIEEAFLTKSVPYQVLGTKFFERKEVKDIISFLRAGLNPDSLTDIKRIINVPARGIGKVTILKIFSGERESLPAGTKIKINQFFNLLTEIGKVALEKKPSEVIQFIIKESGIEKDLKDSNDEDKERLENMRELATLAIKYDYLPIGEGIEKLIEEAALATDQDSLEKNDNAVKLMTVHASKGLEFDYVFITGLEEGLFPHERMNAGKNKDDGEEERRLFYVALTRAKKKIFLTNANSRTIFGSSQICIPSQFISDIDEEFLETDETFEYREKIIYLEL
ncbi:MAG: UvrD-helicase domain-containing protein [Candidatus Paceibacterota bacterium]